MIDFVQHAAFLKQELGTFYHARQRAQNEADYQRAADQLHRALNKMEPLAEDPGPLWDHLPEVQRWGYIKLVSYVGSATHELKMVRAHNQQLVDVGYAQAWEMQKEVAKSPSHIFTES